MTEFLFAAFTIGVLLGGLGVIFLLAGLFVWVILSAARMNSPVEASGGAAGGPPLEPYAEPRQGMSNLREGAPYEQLSDSNALPYVWQEGVPEPRSAADGPLPHPRPRCAPCSAFWRFFTGPGRPRPLR